MTEIWHNGRLAVDLVLEVNELGAVRPHWDCLAAHPKVDPEIYLGDLARSVNVIGPAVMIARRDSVVVGLLIGKLQYMWLDVRVAWLRVFRTRGRVLAVLDGGLIGADDPEVAEAFLCATVKLLRQRLVDYAHLAAIDVSQPLWTLAQSRVPWLGRCHATSTESRWFLALPDTYDAFLASRSRKTRSHIRQNEKTLMRTHPAVRVERFGRGDTRLHAAFSDVMTVFKNTYQCKLGLSALGDARAQARWDELCRLQRLILALVYIGHRPVAFSYAQVFKTTAALMTPGYDPGLAQVNVGQYCLLQLIQALIGDKTLRTLDYGLGYSQYKESLGSGYTKQGHLRLFAPTFKGVYLNLIRSSTTAASSIARGTVAKLGLRSYVKRLWRSAR